MEKITTVFVGQEAQGTLTSKKLTKGQYRVGISFNPGGHEGVNTVEEKCAELIDYIESVSVNSSNTEVKRLCALAQTEIEEAAMNAVKAITKPNWE